VVTAWLAAAWAATVSMQFETDRIEVDQTVGLVVTVVDYRDGARVESVEAPPGVDVDFVRRGDFMSQTGRAVTRGTEFRFAVTPRAEGLIRVGPATLVVDDVAVSADAIPLTVGPRTTATPDEAFTVFAEFPTTTLYEGQVVVYHYGLHARVPVYADGWMLPPVDRLASPRDGLPIQREYVVQDPSGPITTKETWAPLFPTSAGLLEVPPATATLRVPTRGGRRTPFGLVETRDLSATTSGVTLDVRPLPPTPPGFSGLVGEFEVEGALDTDHLATGESATVTVRVRGDGDLAAFSLPAAPASTELRFYDAVVGADARVQGDGRYLAEGRWQRVLVPLVPGTVAVPDLEVVTFSPTRGEYVTHRIAVGPLTVRPGQEGAVDVASFGVDGPPVDAEPADDDLRPLRDGALHAGPIPRTLTALILLAALPGLIGLGRVGFATWASRRAPREAAPRDRLADAPPGAPGRVDALDDALRAALSGPVPPNLADDVARVRAMLSRARFADGALSDADDAHVVRVLAALRGGGR
jgi:hypothetical protein